MSCKSNCVYTHLTNTAGDWWAMYSEDVDTAVWAELCDTHWEEINTMTKSIIDYINFWFENTVPLQDCMVLLNKFSINTDVN